MSLRRSLGLNVIIIMVLFLSWIITAGASGVFVLKNIEVNPKDESNHIRLEFDSVFSGDPLINFESGSSFARYGSAEKYYEDSIDYICNQYPYDSTSPVILYDT